MNAGPAPVGPFPRCERRDYVTDRRCKLHANHDGYHQLPDGTIFGIGWTPGGPETKPAQG